MIESKKFTYTYIPNVHYELDINGYWPTDTVYITYKVFRNNEIIAKNDIQIEQRDQMAYIRDQLTEILEDFENEDRIYNEYCERSKQATKDNFDTTMIIGETWLLE